jgi:DNA primase
MDAVAEVKSRLSIEDVIGEYVQLKRSGRNYKGLSPFTNEKTASLRIVHLKHWNLPQNFTSAN